MESKPMNTNSCLVGAILCCALSASTAGAADVAVTLQSLHEDSLWGEITLESGGIRQIQVQSLTADTVVVREVIGALHVRPAIYSVAQIRSAREIGVYRIPQRTAPFRRSRSTKVAFGLELVIPGAGFFYVGDISNGYRMLGFAALVGGTALATGGDSAAGWLPFAAWTKVASLAQLRDQVNADNGAFHDHAESMTKSEGFHLPIMGFRF
jgi:hypothetical protein